MYGYRNPAPVAFYGERYSPVPGWGMCPNLAGDPIIGIGAAPSDSGVSTATLGIALVAAFAFGVYLGRAMYKAPEP